MTIIKTNTKEEQSTVTEIKNYEELTTKLPCLTVQVITYQYGEANQHLDKIYSLVLEPHQLPTEVLRNTIKLVGDVDSYHVRLHRPVSQSLRGADISEEYEFMARYQATLLYAQRIEQEITRLNELYFNRGRHTQEGLV